MRGSFSAKIAPSCGTDVRSKHKQTLVCDERELKWSFWVFAAFVCYLPKTYAFLKRSLNKVAESEFCAAAIVSYASMLRFAKKASLSKVTIARKTIRKSTSNSCYPVTSKPEAKLTTVRYVSLIQIRHAERICMILQIRHDTEPVLRTVCHFCSHKLRIAVLNR